MAKFESKIHLITKLTTAVLKCPDCKTSGGVNDKGIVEWEKICAKHKEEYGKIHAKEPERLVKAPDGTDLPIIAPTKIADFMENLTEEVYGEPTKKKKLSQDVKDFLWLQSRVLEKLAMHPELYRVLDKMSFTEIWDRLVGKSGLEGVPAHMGGNLEMRATKDTHKYFADLEKKLAKDGEKAYDLKNIDEPHDTGGFQGGFQLHWDEERGFNYPRNAGIISNAYDLDGKPKKSHLGRIKELDKNKKENVKLCTEHRKAKGLDATSDYHYISCEHGLCHDDCPILVKKEGEKNAKKDV